jgi:uncharacterized phage protein gp47/JayE
MAFVRPTPTELRTRIAAEVAAALPGADARQRRSVEEVLVRMIAVASHELHGHLAWAARQILVDSADAGQLDRHAAIWGITRLPAAAAQGLVEFGGGSIDIVPAGTELIRADGARFVLLDDTNTGAPGGVVRAIVPGAAGNTAAGVDLALATPVGGIEPFAGVGAGGLAAGADAESDASLRARVLARIQAPPAGGARDDYVAWARGVAGVGRVWVLPLWLGAGTVGVTLLDASGAVPAAPLVAQVQAAIDLLRPVTAAVTVFAPTVLAVPVNLQISPDNAATRAAILAELDAFFVREAEPGGTLRLSRLAAAISSATGETWHRVLAPTADVVCAAGQIALRGTVTWS